MQWELTIGETKTILHPTWQQIQENLLSLDGIHLDEVGIRLLEKGTVIVAGGDNGRYMVVYFPVNHPDEPSLTLTDLTLSGPLVKLTIQTTDEHEPRYAVQWPLVQRITEHFFKTGELPRDVRWELDNSGKEAIL